METLEVLMISASRKRCGAVDVSFKRAGRACRRVVIQNMRQTPRQHVTCPYNISTGL